MSVSLDRPPIADQPISVVIPQGAGEVVAPMVAHLAPQWRSHKHEIFVAPFGGATEGLNNCKLLPGESNYGAALAAGIKAAQHPLLFVWPAQWGNCAVELARFLGLIDQVDVVVGHRPGRSWLTRFREGWSAHLWLGLGLNDVHCPVRLYRRTVLERVPIQSQGRFADVELLAKANFVEALMVEVELPPASASPKDSAWSVDFRRLLFRPEFLPPAPAPA